MNRIIDKNFIILIYQEIYYIFYYKKTLIYS